MRWLGIRQLAIEVPLALPQRVPHVLRQHGSPRQESVLPLHFHPADKRLVAEQTQLGLGHAVPQFPVAQVQAFLPHRLDRDLVR